VTLAEDSGLKGAVGDGGPASRRVAQGGCLAARAGLGRAVVLPESLRREPPGGHICSSAKVMIHEALRGAFPGGPGASSAR